MGLGVAGQVVDPTDDVEPLAAQDLACLVDDALGELLAARRVGLALEGASDHVGDRGGAVLPVGGSIPQVAAELAVVPTAHVVVAQLCLHREAIDPERVEPLRQAGLWVELEHFRLLQGEAAGSVLDLDHDLTDAAVEVADGHVSDSVRHSLGGVATCPPLDLLDERHVVGHEAVVVEALGPDADADDEVVAAGRVGDLEVTEVESGGGGNRR